MKITLPNVASQILRDVGLKIEDSKTPDPEKPPEEDIEIRWTGGPRSNFDAPEGLHSAASIWWYNFMRWLWGKPNKFGRFVKGNGWKAFFAMVITGIVIYAASRSPITDYGYFAFTAFTGVGYVFRWATSHKRSYGGVKRERAGYKVPRAVRTREGDMEYLYTTQEYNRTTVYDLPEETADYFIWIDVVETLASNGTLTREWSEDIGNIAWGEGRYKELGNARVDEIAKTVTIIPDDPQRVIEAFEFIADRENYPEEVREKVRKIIADMYKWARSLDEGDKVIEQIAGKRIIKIERPSKETKFFIDTLTVEQERIIDHINKAKEKIQENPDETIDLVNEARQIQVEKGDVDKRIRMAVKKAEAKTKVVTVDTLSTKPESAVKGKMGSELPLEEKAQRSANLQESKTLEDELKELFDGEGK